MEPFGVKAIAVALTAATLLAVRAVKKKSLSTAGARVGFCVGFLIVATGLRGLVLFGFYQLGSWATKYKASVKAGLDATATAHSCRGARQVLAVTVTAVSLSLVHAVACGKERPVDFAKDPVASRLTCAVLAHHATCLADTWASELGMITQRGAATVILVTRPWRKVPAGTNGGISIVGTVWSIIGGAAVGLLTVLMDALSGIYPLNAWTMVAFGALTGFVGSLVDSVLGATVQATYWDPVTKLIHHDNGGDVDLSSLKHLSGISILTNEQVNFVSVALTSLLGGWVLGPWFFSL